MMAMIHQGSCSVARAIVIVQYESHRTETETGKMTWTGSEKDHETGTGKRVEAEKGMITNEIEVKKEIGIGENVENKNSFYQILLSKVFYENWKRSLAIKGCESFSQVRCRGKKTNHNFCCQFMF